MSCYAFLLNHFCSIAEWLSIWSRSKRPILCHNIIISCQLDAMNRTVVIYRVLCEWHTAFWFTVKGVAAHSKRHQLLPTGSVLQRFKHYKKSAFWFLDIGRLIAIARKTKLLQIRLKIWSQKSTIPYKFCLLYSPNGRWIFVMRRDKIRFNLDHKYMKSFKKIGLARDSADPLVFFIASKMFLFRCGDFVWKSTACYGKWASLYA